MESYNMAMGNNELCLCHNNTLVIDCPVHNKVDIINSLSPILPSPLENALLVLKRRLTSDVDYYDTWKGLIAGCFYDEYHRMVNTGEDGYTFSMQDDTLSLLSDNAAKNFLNYLIQ